MGIEVCKNPNSSECIRCGDCMKACPTKAIEKR
ncbi:MULTISPECIES: 4Fe-4S binding protein [unclassified Sedimentibacter]